VGAVGAVRRRGASCDVTLVFSPELAMLSANMGTRKPPPEASSVHVAVREQLGLWLEPATGPFEVLVIDSAEMP
jgi:uncharacterized protein (TIGR03435 family)